MNSVLIKDVDNFSSLTKNALISIGINYTWQLSLLSKKDLNMICKIGQKGRLSIVNYCNVNLIPFSERSGFADMLNSKKNFIRY
jgi:hypothetical protein